MVDALILDLGNVLAFHDNALLFRELATAFGATAEVLRQRLDGGLWERVNRGLLPGDALRVELVSRLGGTLTPEAWFELWNCHFVIHEAMVKALEPLVGRVKLVLLSNTHDDHFRYLRPRLPILDRFDGLVLSFDVGLIKPEPGIYHRALSLAGVPAERAAFFDDVPAYAEAATRLGLQGRVFTTAEDFRVQGRRLGLPL
jgi:FMN phosphatase YigB (HAD superfamily)